MDKLYEAIIKGIHKALNESVSKVVVVINNLGISLKDTKIFGGIIRTKEMGYFDISSVNCSDILRNEFVKK